MVRSVGGSDKRDQVVQWRRRVYVWMYAGITVCHFQVECAVMNGGKKGNMACKLLPQVSYLMQQLKLAAARISVASSPLLLLHHCTNNHYQLHY